jgi:hypothetical protein
MKRLLAIVGTIPLWPILLFVWIGYTALRCQDYLQGET